MELSLRVVRYDGRPPEQEMALVVGEQGCTIGRAPGNDLVLPDPERQVSKLHAQIEFHDGSFYLTDESTNGTSIIGDTSLMNVL